MCVYVNVTLAGQVICETNCYQPCFSLSFGHRLRHSEGNAGSSIEILCQLKSFEEQFEILKTWKIWKIKGNSNTSSIEIYISNAQELRRTNWDIKNFKNPEDWEELKNLKDKIEFYL